MNIDKEKIDKMLQISFKKGAFIEYVPYLLYDVDRVLSWSNYLDEFGKKFPNNKQYLAELKRIEEQKKQSKEYKKKYQHLYNYRYQQIPK